MIYNKLRNVQRVALVGACLAFLSFNSTAQEKRAKVEFKPQTTRTGTATNVSKRRQVAKPTEEIHVKSHEYISKKLGKGTPAKQKNGGAVIPTRSKRNITAAGDTLFFEDFQGGTFPTDMQQLNVDGLTPAPALATQNGVVMGTNAWIVADYTFLGGPENFAALSNSWYTTPLPANDWLITPPITLTSNNLLRWNARAVDPQFPDGYEVRMCTNCPANVTSANVATAFSTTLFSIAAEEAAANFAYQERQIDLSTYAGQTVRLAFRNNSTDQFLLGIDNIFVGRQLAVDAELTALTALFSNQCTLGSNESVKVKVANKGSLALATVPVSIKVNNVQAGLGTITNLDPNETDSVTISGLDLSAIGTYEIEASVNVVDDGNLANNSIAGATQKVAPQNLTTGYLQSFEDGDNLDNWIILDNNGDGASWVNFQTPGAGENGTTGYMGYADLAPIPSDGDDWMITSCFTAEAGVKYQYFFSHRTTGPLSHNIALMAGNSQEPSALTQTLFSGSNFAADNVWHQEADTFSVPTTGLYYFGVHATSPAGDGRFRLDELRFRVAPSVDASVRSILFPNPLSYICGSATQQFAYAIKNNGTQELTNIPVNLSLSGAASQTLNMTVPTLAPFETDTIVFNGTVDISNGGDYNATIFSSVTGDSDISSDSSSISFSVAESTTYPLEDDFEALQGQGDLPEGWWTDQFGSIAEHGVDGSLGVSANLYSAVLEANLISPRIVNIDPTGYLTFKYRLVNFDDINTEYAMSAGDSIIIWASKNCGPFVRLKNITSDDHVASVDFAKMIIPLTDLNIGLGDAVTIRIQGLHNGAAGDYWIDIDEYGVKTVAPFDLKVVKIKQPVLSKVKLKHADPVSLGGSVANEGTQDFGQWRLITRVTPGTYADSAGLNALASGTTQDVNMANPFTPTQTGLYTVTYTAKSVSASQIDSDLSNNEMAVEYEVTDSTMGRDVGDATPLNYPTTYLGRKIVGQVYRLKTADTLTSISFWADDLAESVSIKGYFCRTNATTGAPTPVTGNDSTSSIVDLEPGDSFNWHTVSFKKPSRPLGIPLVGNARYLFGIINTAGNFTFGLNTNNYEAATSYLWFNGSFGSSDNLLTTGGNNVFVRPNFGRLITTATRTQIEMSLANADLYPNPTTGASRLAINLNKPSSVQVAVHNLAGQAITSKSFDASKGRNVLDLPTTNLAKGVYMVKVNAEGYAVTKKLVID